MNIKLNNGIDLEEEKRSEMINEKMTKCLKTIDVKIFMIWKDKFRILNQHFQN